MIGCGKVPQARALHIGVDRIVRMLLVSGSLREQSTSTATLRTAAMVAPAGIEAVLYDGLAGLPAFNPDDDGVQLPPAVASLRAAIRHADALVVSTPEYAGALPGSFKNLLDWMIGDDQPGSIYRKPVGWINVSAYGAVNAHDSLSKVLRYASADVVDPACQDVAVARSMITSAGLIADPDVQKALLGVLQLLSNHVLSRETTE